MTRLMRAWGELHPEQRLAGLAALGLLVTMFLPWYELQSLNRKTGAIHSQSISAFGDVSFVEAAIFLVAVGVLALLFARGERRQFHLPGSDGTIVTIAGCWAALLIFYRVFSRPDGHGYPVGIQWGFFLAFVAAGGLAYAGWKMRAAAAPEPPLVRRPRRHASPRTGEPHTGDAPRFRARSAGASPRPLADEDATVVVPSAPSLARTPAAPAPSQSSPRTPGQPPKRPRYPPAPPDQLSFDDAQDAEDS